MRILTYLCEKSDITVKNVLQKHFNMASSIITALKNTNGILVNGEHVTVRKTMDRGDELKLIIPEKSSQNITLVKGNLEILYEDEDILCVNKPPLMPTHPSQNHHTDTLANIVMYYYKDVPFTFRASNRLDSYTSGIVVIAKNMYSASFLCTNSFRQNIKKTYYAICRGTFSQKKGTVVAPISRCEGSTIKRCVSDTGKYACTEYEVIKENNNLSLVKLNLKTGRTHQIRVHMSYLGHPLNNDFIYDDMADKNMHYLLHCGKVSFIHPINGKEINVVSKLPSDYNI